MKLNNRKGFMLAEVVIVASVVSAVLISIYISLNRLSQAYETRNRYNDVDAMYAAIELDKVSDENIVFLRNYEAVDTRENEFINYYNRGSFGKTIESAYYIRADVAAINDLLEDTDDVELKEYLEYLREGIDASVNDYLVLAQLKKGVGEDAIYYFYTLKHPAD